MARCEMGKHAQNHVLGDTPRVKEYTTQRPFKAKNNLSPKTEPLNLYELGVYSYELSFKTGERKK